jgi:hypothetical protein
MQTVKSFGKAKELSGLAWEVCLSRLKMKAEWKAGSSQRKLFHFLSKKKKHLHCLALI